MRVINEATLKEWFDLTLSGENDDTILEQIANIMVDEAKASHVELSQYKEMQRFVDEYIPAVIDGTIISQPEVNAINKEKATKRVDGSVKGFPLGFFEAKNMKALIWDLQRFDQSAANPITAKVTDLILQYANRFEETLGAGVVAGVAVRLRGLKALNTGAVINQTVYVLNQGRQMIRRYVTAGNTVASPAPAAAGK